MSLFRYVLPNTNIWSYCSGRARAGLKSALDCPVKPLKAAEFPQGSRFSDFVVPPASDGFSPSRQGSLSGNHLDNKAGIRRRNL